MNLLQHLFHALRNIAVRLIAASIALLCFTASSASAITYSDNGDGTVSDPTTGLIWMHCVVGQTWTGSTCVRTANAPDGYTWDEAILQADNYVFPGVNGEYHDWRLPTISELRTIVDWSTSPAMDTAVFPDPNLAQHSANWNSALWTSSIDLSFPDNAISISDHSSTLTGKNSAIQVRLVRGVQSSTTTTTIATTVASVTTTTSATTTTTTQVAQHKTYSDNGDGTVTDPITGLTWMRCAMGQTWDGTTCTGTVATYSWDQATALTERVTFASQSDWRLPNIRELQTVVNRSVTNPAIDRVAFPNIPSLFSWSSSPSASDASSAWVVGFSDGAIVTNEKLSNYQVRLVRSEQTATPSTPARPTSDYIDHGDGTVTHTPTGLMWKRCSEGQTWSASTCTGTASYVWNATRLYTQGFAGRNDWGLPTEEELLTLVDYTRFDPVINATVFPNTSAMHFGSSTFYAGNADNSSNAWYVYFGYGWAQYAGNGSYGVGVRLVRGGQPLNTFPLNVSRSGTGSVTSTLTGINCGSICTANYNAGTKVILTATPAGGVTWSGACSGTAPTCTVTMDATKTITATIKDVPIISGLPTSLQFPLQNVGSSSTVKTATLTNTGSAPLSISSISANGDFAVTHNCGMGLGVGSFCVLSITFTPTLVGVREGVLSIVSDAYGSPHTISLLGTGRGAAAVVSPSGVSFGSQNVGIASVARTLTLSNTGSATLNIGNISASGDFAVTHTCGAELSINGFCTLSVTFTPASTGTRTGIVTIADDAIDSPQTVTLNGIGQGATALLNTTAKTFASQGLGSTSPPQIVTLTNASDAVLNISGIAASGDFAQTNNCGGGLTPGGSCSIRVIFRPTAVGARSGSIVISSDAANNPNSVALSGTGLSAPVVLLNPTLLNFPVQDVETSSAAKSITLTNSGVVALSLSSIVASGDFTQTNNCGGGVVPGGSCSIEVIFAPTVTGTRSGAVTIASNAPTSPNTVSLASPLYLAQGWNLLGNGIDQVIDVASFFGDPLAATTIWKWDTTKSGWQFYAPLMDAPALQTYAASKGYGVLSVINPGEGFWVNANRAFTKALPSGTAVTAISFQEIQARVLKTGWNLVSIGNTSSPSGFNAVVGALPPASGVIPQNLITLWAWDSTPAQWYFYAPSLEAKGGTALTDYIATKGYLDFAANNRELAPGTGFWVNVPQPAAATTTTTATTTQVTTTTTKPTTTTTATTTTTTVQTPVAPSTQLIIDYMTITHSQMLTQFAENRVAVEREAAARGGLLSGATIKAVQQAYVDQVQWFVNSATAFVSLKAQTMPAYKSDVVKILDSYHTQDILYAGTLYTGGIYTTLSASALASVLAELKSSVDNIYTIALLQLP